MLSLYNGIFKPTKFKFLPLWFILTCVTIIVSCTNNGDSTSVIGSSYNKILDSTVKYYDKNRLEAGVRYLDSATPSLERLTPIQKYQFYSHHVTYYTFAKNDKAKSLKYADSMLMVFNTADIKGKYTKEIGQTHFLKGDLLFDLGRFNEAYEQYYQGKVIVSAILDNCTLSEYSYRMGMVTYKQEQYRLATRYFKKAFAEGEKCSLDFRAFYRRQELLDNIALSYDKLHQPDSALMYYNAALKYVHKHGYKYPEKKEFMDIAEGVVYGNMAKVYTELGEYEKATTLLNKSIAINLRKGNDIKDAQLTEIKLANLYLKRNKIDSVLPIATKLRQQLDTTKNMSAEADWNYLMAQYFNKKNNQPLAIKHFLAYDALKDSLNHQNQALKETNILELIKRFEKEYELTAVKKDKDLQSIYLKIAAVFTIMSVIILALIWQNAKKSKKNILMLGSLNKQINEQNHHLEYAMNELKQNSQEKDRILRTVAHDLRNPLGGIASLTSVMVEEAEYNDEQKELLKIIKDTSFDSLELINEILEATNSNTAEFNKQWVDINSLLNNSVELLRFKAAEKNQQINLEMLELPVELLINREKIWRVVSNLISNAIKFSPVGAPITVSVFEHEDDVQIAVKDNGIGIPDAIKHKVFNMFTDAKRPGTLGEKSFGLGLSICRQIIEKHNGKIWFESNPTNGTTFYISLHRDIKTEHAEMVH